MRLKCTCGGERFEVWDGVKMDSGWKHGTFAGLPSSSRVVLEVDQPNGKALKCQSCGKLWRQVTEWKEV